MQWYGEDQLNAQRAAHILLCKLPQMLQRRPVVEQFGVLSVDFIYKKGQDYMTWLLVSRTRWKDTLEDFMDLGTCALNGVETSIETNETPTVNVVSNLSLVEASIGSRFHPVAN